MNTPIKQLDRKFLSFYYRDMINDIEEIYEIFLSEIPHEINSINDLIIHKEINEALEHMHKILPSFQNIGLPQLTVKLQIIEVYLKVSNISTAKLLIRSFIKELNDYMPAILSELNRLKTDTCKF